MMLAKKNNFLYGSDIFKKVKWEKNAFETETSVKNTHLKESIVITECQWEE